jgi:hypothetical protein
MVPEYIAQQRQPKIYFATLRKLRAVTQTLVEIVLKSALMIRASCANKTKKEECIKV